MNENIFKIWDVKNEIRLKKEERRNFIVSQEYEMVALRRDEEKELLFKLGELTGKNWIDLHSHIE